VRRDLALPLVGTALLVALTGCNLIPNDETSGPTPGPVTSVAAPTTAEASPTKAPQSTSGSPESTTPLPTSTDGTITGSSSPDTSDPSPSPPASVAATLSEEDLVEIREALYLDEWVRTMSLEFGTSALALRGVGEPVEPAVLKQSIEDMIRSKIPAGFESVVEATVLDQFAIRVWHPRSYLYRTAENAYLSRSEDLTSTDPIIDPRNMSLEPLMGNDYPTAEIVFNTATAVRHHLREHDGELPTEARLRELNLIHEGFEWSIAQSPIYPDQFIIRAWHPEGWLFNSEKNAAYRDTFVKDQLRPASNFNFNGFKASTGWTLPRDLGTPPAPAPSSTGSAVPDPIPTQG
jgi:hypothetical protein